MGQVVRHSPRWIAIGAAFCNLGIHLAMVPDHLAEMLYIGILFIIGSALLGMVMVGLATDRDRLRTIAWVGGSLVCAVEFILFVLSRTVGLPMGYKEGWLGIEGMLGLSSLFVEVLFIACAAVSLSRVPARHEFRQTRVLPWHDRTALLP